MQAPFTTQWLVLLLWFYLPFAGTLDQENTWQSIFTAATKFTKKLLVLQCHNPPQTIALYLPHQYPGEGVFPCVTYRADGQPLSATTWAFGVDGFSSKQQLAGHCIDLDNSKRLLQIYRPKPFKPQEKPVLGDASSRANSYLCYHSSSGSCARCIKDPAAPEADPRRPLLLAWGPA